MGSQQQDRRARDVEESARTLAGRQAAQGATGARRAVKRGLWPCVALLAAGCAATPPKVVEPPPAIDSAAAQSWTAQGRLAVAVAGQGGSGAFTWRQESARSELAVRGPLGVGAFNVTVTG